MFIMTTVSQHLLFSNRTRLRRRFPFHKAVASIVLFISLLAIFWLLCWTKLFCPNLVKERSEGIKRISRQRSLQPEPACVKGLALGCHSSVYRGLQLVEVTLKCLVW